MVDFFIEKYMFSDLDGLGNPLISGLYIGQNALRLKVSNDASESSHVLAAADDVWDGGNDVDQGPSEVGIHWKADTGFSDADTSAMIAAYRWVADKTYATFLER